MTVSNSGSCEPSASSTSPAQTKAALPPPAVAKKKRNLPGMPDPDAEVIALSPRTLMATNRFICEICNKGFQRDQNLQLHRRGHNLPWKLRQRTNKDVKKRVYVCPEPSCVHHDSSRALGDLTGIKKHFCRKHGEKKWRCDKCSKKYAVQSDWKAHYKTCGSREYRCDCGTLFSRRDSFITHRAFCDALVEESAKVVQTTSSIPAVSGTSEEDPMVMVPSPPPVLLALNEPEKRHQNELESDHNAQPPAHTATASIFASLFSSSSAAAAAKPSPASTFADLMGVMSTTSQQSGFITLPTTSQMFDREAGGSTLAPTSGYVPVLKPPPSPHMSATALLQKAAQMGAAATNSSTLRGFGLSASTTASPTNNQESREEFRESYQWRGQIDPHSLGLSSGLGLRLPYDNTIGGIGCEGLPELLSLCGAKPTTLDFLGLGMVGPEGSGAGLSALLSSIGGGAGGGVSRFGSGGSPVSMSNGNCDGNLNGNESNNGMNQRI